MVAQTYGMISHIDDCIGKIMRFLETSGLAQSTVVVFTSDHGEYLGAHHLLHKAEWPFEELLRVPLIVKDPQASQANISQSVVSHLDLVPTILDYAGVEQSALDGRGVRHSDWEGLPGRSLRRLIRDGQTIAKRPALMEYDDDWWAGPVFRTRCLIEGRYKIVMISAPGGGGLLYDLQTDPREEKNLWDAPEYVRVKSELTEKLVFEIMRTDRLQDQRRMVGA